MNDATVRLAADADTHPNIRGSEKYIFIRGKIGESVGFQPIVFQLDGELASLGHFRQEGHEGESIRGYVEAFASKSGYHVAVVAKFEHQQSNGPWMSTPEAAVASLAEPVGTTKLGTLNLMAAQQRIMKKRFVELFPGQEKAYTAYIGAYE